MQLKLDLHVHTERSRDAFTTLEELFRYAKLRGLDGVAVTEHDLVTDVKTSLDIIVIPGIEVSSLDGHVLGLGVSDHIERGLSADETVDRIKESGGLAVIPHPYDVACSSVRPGRLSIRPDAIETINSSAALFHLAKFLAERDAVKLSVPTIGASDSHIPQSLGDAFTLVDSESDSLDDILKAIRAGRANPVGGATNITNKLRKVTRALF